MQTTTKMTIHRALAELKLLDSKIEKGINEIYPAAIFQKGKKIDGHLTEEEFKKNAEGSYQSVSDLISRKVKIKSAIVKSNAATSVEVAGKIMTVTDAITFKAIVETKQKLISYLKQKNQAALAALSRNNDIVSKNVEVLLQNAFGKDSTKVSKEDADAVSKPYLENNTFHLIDPLKIAEKISDLEKETLDFEADVDACLSESNAISFIEI